MLLCYVLLSVVALLCYIVCVGLLRLRSVYVVGVRCLRLLVVCCVSLFVGLMCIALNCFGVVCFVCSSLLFCVCWFIVVCVDV